MIPVNEPLLDGNERSYLLRCVDEGWISSGGPFVRQLEEGFGAYLGLPPGVAVCNGTAALETALFALGVQPGDEIIMPSFTITASTWRLKRRSQAICSMSLGKNICSSNTTAL